MTGADVQMFVIHIELLELQWIKWSSYHIKKSRQVKGKGGHKLSIRMGSQKR